MDIDLKELSISEVQRIVGQLINADESRVVKSATVKDFKIL
jgi:hypothetical protein